MPFYGIPFPVSRAASIPLIAALSLSPKDQRLLFGLDKQAWTGSSSRYHSNGEAHLPLTGGEKFHRIRYGIFWRTQGAMLVHDRTSRKIKKELSRERLAKQESKRLLADSLTEERRKTKALRPTSDNDRTRRQKRRCTTDWNDFRLRNGLPRRRLPNPQITHQIQKKNIDKNP